MGAQTSAGGEIAADGSAPATDLAQARPDADAAPNAPVSRAGRAGVLRHTHFRRVWFAALGSSVGTWMESVGVQWLMAEQTGSPVQMGYLALAQLGPMLVLGLAGGLVAGQRPELATRSQ